MMQWKKEVTFTKRYYVLGYLVPLLALISFVTGEFIMLSLTLFSVIVLVLNNLYLSYTAKHIAISEGVLIRRLFPEEKTTLTVPFENQGKIPFFHVNASFFLYYPDESVEVIESEKETAYYSNYESPFTLGKLSKRNVGIHIEALKRGTAQLRNIHVDIYDLFMFSHVRLKYEGSYRGEVLVYPTPLPIMGLEKVIQQERGDHPQPSSLNEDVLMTMGNRDYTTSDPFNRINWKASARTNELQTKIFEKVTISQWTLVLNIRNEDSLVPTIPHLEAALSQATYACQFATKHHISFEMYINIRIPGSSVGMHLPLGNGKGHLAKALEILTRIRKSNMTIPVENMLNVIVKNPTNNPFILHFGAFGEREIQAYQKVKQHGGTVNHVAGDDGNAYLRPVRGKNHEQMAN